MPLATNPAIFSKMKKGLLFLAVSLSMAVWPAAKI